LTQGDRSRRRRSVALALDAHYLWILTAPAVLVLLLVTAVPFVVALATSFTDYGATRQTWSFVGLDNYVALLDDPTFSRALTNTVYMVTVIVVVETILGLGLAVLLARSFRGIGFVRSVFITPLMTPAIVVAITWRALFNTNSGWINYLLGLVGLPQPDWLGNPVIAMPSIIIADMWVGIPFVAILLVAALLAVPREQQEAAAIDGAGAWQVFRHVTLPAIRPVLAVVVMFRAIDAFKKFESVQVITGGGPGDATTNLNLYVYEVAFLFLRMGSAAAIAVVLILVMLIALFAISRLTRVLG
jgi:multiple sugar transport system permease protein